MPGELFTHYFLTEGIKTTAEWRDSELEFTDFRARLTWIFQHFGQHQHPNEAVTEQELIRPILELLGWTEYLPQQGASRNEDIPDMLLFGDAESKARAAGRTVSADRFEDAVVVEESKRNGRALESRGGGLGSSGSTPHGQILRYLSTADVESKGTVRWGILTNGDVWRLYDYRTRPRSSGYFEVDAAPLHGEFEDDQLRLFYLLFNRKAFTLQHGATTTFIEDAIEEGRRYEERVAQDLSNVVFGELFPKLATALAQESHGSLDEVRSATLIFLYRLLFVLYAEDRGLLPVNDSRYDDYGLRKRVRDDISARMERQDTLSTAATSYYDHLSTLFRLIDNGDSSIGLPPYNGGLFSADAARLLESARVADSVIGPVVYAMSHSRADLPPGSTPRFVNYRDMSVQQLGSIYERLLERELSSDPDGGVYVRLNPYARKDSGSFFTPQNLVDLIIDRTLKPLAEERLRAFEKRAAELKEDRRPRSQKREELENLDPAQAVLNLKVLDPAMGSGHFLVTAVDFLTDYIVDLIEYVPAVPEWLNGEYVSPLVERIVVIHEGIKERAQEAGWALDDEQLTDQAIIRRMVLKQCIFGVDKNPLTVELAKVSLWLHSFTTGAPLSFLDHHLRHGDSLLGLRVSDAAEDMERLGGPVLSSAIQSAENAAAGMRHVEGLSDANIAEVRESAALFGGVEQATAGLRGVMDFLCGLRWKTAGMKKREREAVEAPLREALDAPLMDVWELLGSGLADDSRPALAELWHEARADSGREKFLHWEATFPGVWRGWENARPSGGFDAVIGNPPWDKIKLQEVEWFATRDSELALAPTAAERRAGIRRLREQGEPLAAEFDEAKARADRLGSVIRRSGDYPLLGGGDINLYSLFVERAMRLVKPDGFVGLLTPSGIYADKTAARFFESISTSGRLGSLFDFENKKIFFKEIHASFKFCALVFGGEERTFEEAECAFFLHDTAEIGDAERCFPLAPSDFARVNPNTGTAPVFRTRRDAEITRRIYERHPVLVDRSGGEERRAAPVRYRTMFHMTNDSGLFRTAERLAAEGFYPVQGNRWQKGEELYLPLYQGRMISHFDHRANSVRVNPENTHNPYLSEPVSQSQHADPDFLPQTQYWVPAADVEEIMPGTQGYTLGFRDIARPTDVRTMITAIVPWAGYGNTAPLIVGNDAWGSACLVANLSAYCLDFAARQKAQGTHMNWYIVEQLPVIAPEDYDRRFGDKTARELVRDHVLRLTYTAHDLAPFARDLGYEGPPFTWDEEERRHLRARLDALFFHLYGLDREDAGYVLDTFPIVRREDTQEFGSYRTLEMVLAYMNALAAGDTTTDVGV